jgi:hypothetical protein
METYFHPLKELFKQLGLPSSCKSIDEFIAKHAPLNQSILLDEADFWNFNQRNFLHDELLNDADWAEAIDLLNSQLRQPRKP